MKYINTEEMQKKLNEDVWKDFQQFMQGRFVKVYKNGAIEFKEYEYELYKMKTFGFHGEK